MCNLCQTGEQIADSIRSSGHSPEDALHILTSAVASIVVAADWPDSLSDVLNAIAQRIGISMAIAGKEAMH